MVVECANQWAHNLTGNDAETAIATSFPSGPHRLAQSLPPSLMEQMPTPLTEGRG
jgi:hypothetical protein